MTKFSGDSRILDACLLMECDLAFPHTNRTLAEYVGLSPFHFSRLFKKTVGESVTAHLRRLRLARAAYALKYSSSSIASIASAAGFQTNAGFTHAFVSAYGSSPRDFRSQQDVTPFLPSLDQKSTRDLEALAACQLSVQIERQPTRRLALMRYVGTTAGMVGHWRKMIDWCKRHELLHDQAILLGIHRDDFDAEDPDGFDSYRYDAAIEVSSKFAPDDEVACTYVPGGETAVVHFQGTLKQLDRIWHRFAHDWLPASGYLPRTSMVFDQYPASLFIGSAFSQIVRTYRGIEARLCIPVSRNYSSHFAAD